MLKLFNFNLLKGRRRQLLTTVLLCGGLLAASGAQAARIVVKVVDQNGTPVKGFRYLVEEDNNYRVTPDTHTADILSFNFHKSHAPNVLSGETGPNATQVAIGTTGDDKLIDRNKDYFVSILPYSGYEISGGQVSFLRNNGSCCVASKTITVTVQQQPIPTATISVFVFRDDQPINGTPDLPEEVGLPGFSIILEDAGGIYGIGGGLMLSDVFGNPLGTKYLDADNDGQADLDGDGSPVIETMGNGVILTDENGVAIIRNLAPAKYGVQAVPPGGSGWHQTSTIEGTPIIDAWPKAGEPTYFQEFGPPGHHADFGFVKYFTDTTALSGGTTISGTITNLHNSRPPNYEFFSGQPIGGCRIGLNDLSVGTGLGVFSQPCNSDGSFSIANTPPGNYQLVVWDEALDLVIASYGILVEPNGGVGSLGYTCNGGSCNLLDVPVFNWFHQLETSAFFDLNQNGFWDADEPNMPHDSTDSTIRFRNGAINQNVPVDGNGDAPFEETFPFFHWLIAESGFASFKATGATYVVDNGGAVDPDGGWSNPTFDMLNPQPQAEINPNTGNNRSRTIAERDTLLLGFQGFLGQTNVIQWGKGTYSGTDNGGITGVIYYATTRAEDDPRYAAAEVWETGVPRVQMNLYADADGNKVPDDINNDNVFQQPDVDNYPLGWGDPDCVPDPANPAVLCNKGPEDIDQSWAGNQAQIFETGDAIAVTWSDSWDDNPPTGCVQQALDLIPALPGNEIEAGKCFDGLRNYNQVREAVFDGGYAFNEVDLNDGNGPRQLPSSMNYIVEAVTPPGYKTIKEEDKNVDFGVVFEPDPQLLPPECVGEMHTVPQYLSLQTRLNSNNAPVPVVPAADLIDAPYAGQPRPLCDRKLVFASPGKNTAADFFLLTEVPKAAHVVGGILNDLANEFDPASPNFGEKFAPPWLPISFRDFTGKEIAHVVSDEFGKFNALLPSTWTINAPMPSGVAPNMITACMNAANDPLHDSRYSQFCYTFQYMPGTTTYLDTPVLPIAAYAGPDQYPLDCEFETLTPLISWVAGPLGGAYAMPGENLTIRAVGNMRVPNPEYNGSNSKTVARNYGFRNAQGNGKAVLRPLAGGADIPLSISNWANLQISATVPNGTAPGQYQLIVTRHNGGITPSLGVTVTVGAPGDVVSVVSPGNGTPIQDAIDAANAGDIILVTPGTYEELVIMHKPVQLQGSGAFSTTINAVKTPSEKLANWRAKAQSLLDQGQYDIVPGQEAGFTPTDNEPLLFGTVEGAGITVVGNDNGEYADTPVARIDGFTITGADTGGAIFVNGYADNLRISNNRLISNAAVAGGGIHIGHENLTSEVGGNLVYSDARNDNITIQYNQITQNGALEGTGGGIALFTGSDNYTVADNMICGNFAQGNGGGIGHLGVSDGGTIERNRIIFNQSFRQDATVHGGGIFLAGQPGLNGNLLSPGSGSVLINANVIHGNLAGAGDGGGIRLQATNGLDTSGAPAGWYRVDVVNNIITNNITGLAGGGMSLQDVANGFIIHNTIANNDSTATAGVAFLPGSPNMSTAQDGAGIVSRNHSLELSAATGQTFSDPVLVNNVVWDNRQFHFEITNTTSYGLIADGFSDLAVLGAAGSLSCVNCIDSSGFPNFVNSIINLGAGQTLQQPEFTTTLDIAVAFDEGGNFIDMRMYPLTMYGFAAAGGNYVNPPDYHRQGDLSGPSPSDGAPIGSYLGDIPALNGDIDNQARPTPANTNPDIGADEVNGTPLSAAANGSGGTPAGTLNDPGAPVFAQLYFSTLGNPVIPGVGGANDDADVYTWYGNTGNFERVVDARPAYALPGNADIDALDYMGADNFCVSFNRNDSAGGTSVPGFPAVSDKDVMCYQGNGQWTRFFDGAAELGSSNGQDIDALDINGDTMYFSTAGGGNDNPIPAPVAGPYDDADIYSWNSATGFERVVDASALGLPGNADVDGLWFNSATDFCVSFLNDTAVAGTVYQDEDVVCYNGVSWNEVFDGTAAGMTQNGHDIDALDLSS